MIPAADNLSAATIGRNPSRGLTRLHRGFLLVALLAAAPLLVWSLPGWSYWLASLESAPPGDSQSRSTVEEELSAGFGAMSHNTGSSSLLLSAGAKLIRIPAEPTQLFDMANESNIEIVDRAQVTRAFARDWPALERLGVQELSSIMVADNAPAVTAWSWMIWTLRPPFEHSAIDDRWASLELPSGPARYRYFIHDQQNFCLLERVSVVDLPTDNGK